MSGDNLGSGGGGGSDYPDPANLPNCINNPPCVTDMTVTDGVQSGNGLITVTYATPVGIGALGSGYWKNHLEDSAMQYLPKSLGNYQVDTIQRAAQVFKGTNCSSSKDQNAIGCLAGQLLATKLSLANGSLACPGILQAVAGADAFLKGQTVNGVPGINYVGPGGHYALTAAQRGLALALKDKLNTYNSNIACP